MQLITFLCPRRSCRRPMLQGSGDYSVWWWCLAHESFEIQRAVRFWETCDACGSTELTQETLNGGPWRVDLLVSDSLRRGRQPDKRALRCNEFYICQRCEAKRAFATVRAA